MANQLLGSDKIAQLNDFNLLGLVQSVDWSPNFNATDIFELGKDVKVDTAMELETQGTLELGSIGGLAGLLARAIVTRNASGAFTGYQYNPAGGNGKNGYTFTQNDLKEAQFDLLIHEKTDETNFDRTVALPRCFITSVAGKADSNGVATETVNFGGDFVVGLPSPYHDARAIPATITGTAEVTLADNTITSTSHGIVYVYVDELRFRTSNTDAQYVTLGTAGKITFTNFDVQTVRPNGVVRALVYKKTSPSSTFPSLTSGNRDTTAFYIRGWQADIYLAPATPDTPTASEQWLKCQSMDFNIDMRAESLRQIAYNAQGTSVFARIPTYPLDVSANVTVYETDWKDWKAVLNKSFPGNDVYQDSYDLAPNNLKSSFAVVLVYRTKSGTVLQTLKLLDMRVDGYGNRVNVGGRSEISWGLKGTQFSLVGANA